MGWVYMGQWKALSHHSQAVPSFFCFCASLPAGTEVLVVFLVKFKSTVGFTIVWQTRQKRGQDLGCPGKLYKCFLSECFLASLNLLCTDPQREEMAARCWFVFLKLKKKPSWDCIVSWALIPIPSFDSPNIWHFEVYYHCVWRFHS